MDRTNKIDTWWWGAVEHDVIASIKEERKRTDIDNEEEEEEEDMDEELTLHVIEGYSSAFQEDKEVVAQQIRKKIKKRKTVQFIWGYVKIGQTVKFDATRSNLQYVDKYIKITSIVEHIYKEEKHFFFLGNAYSDGESIMIARTIILRF